MPGKITKFRESELDALRRAAGSVSRCTIDLKLPIGATQVSRKVYNMAPPPNRPTPLLPNRNSNATLRKSSGRRVCWYHCRQRENRSNPARAIFRSLLWVHFSVCVCQCLVCIGHVSRGASNGLVRFRSHSPSARDCGRLRSAEPGWFEVSAGISDLGHCWYPPANARNELFRKAME